VKNQQPRQRRPRRSADEQRKILAAAREQRARVDA
jgi:hypothetical protein